MYVLKADKIKIWNLKINPAQRIDFLEDVFQMSEFAFVSVINHCHIDGLHLFWDALGCLNIYGNHLTANNFAKNVAQSAGVVEYTNCTSTDGQDPTTTTTTTSVLI